MAKGVKNHLEQRDHTGRIPKKEIILINHN